MGVIEHFDAEIAARLPEACALLRSSRLAVHPAVTRVTLHGSRGLAGGSRPDSDIDLSLLVETPAPPPVDDALESLLREVITATLSRWQGPVEADLAAVFPLRSCGLSCFQWTDYDPALCAGLGVDCFGLYKLQKGFSGFVLGAGIRVERMYPCITVWSRQEG